MRMASVVLATILIGTAAMGSEKIPQIKGRGEWSQQILGLRCRITTDKNEYTIGDKVYVLIEVRNNTKEPIALGIEPLIEVKGGNLVRQRAEIHTIFSQGSPGFFSTVHTIFPRGKKSEAKAVVIKPGQTYSEIVVRTPWGPTPSSIPATAQPGKMTLKASLCQFLTGDLKKMAIESYMVSFTAKSPRADVSVVWKKSASGLAIGISHAQDLTFDVYFANQGTNDIPGLIQSRARFLIELNGKYYAMKDIGGKSSYMPPGRTYGPLKVDTSKFWEIPKLNPNYTIEPNGSHPALKKGKNTLHLHYKLNSELISSAEITIEQ